MSRGPNYDPDVAIRGLLRSSALSKAGARLLNGWPQWLRRGRPWRLGGKLHKHLHVGRGREPTVDLSSA